jgi:hypothetical protein
VAAGIAETQPVELEEGESPRQRHDDRKYERRKVADDSI